jgi:hypothetical protein
MFSGKILRFQRFVVLASVSVSAWVLLTQAEAFAQENCSPFTQILGANTGTDFKWEGVSEADRSKQL